jgi:hypothetical protein
MFRNFKVLLIALVAIAVAGSAYAFAATNSVPASAAGYAGVTVPGYTITGFVYDLDATNPTLVDEITFSISPTGGTGELAHTVYLQTAPTGDHDDWTLCTLEAGTAPAMLATCTYGSLELADVVAVNIVASSTDDTAAP